MHAYAAVTAVTGGTDRPRILVLGAGGVMGRLIVGHLQEDHPGTEIISASRHASAGLRIPHRYLDLSKPASYAGALTGVDVLIHAAGPFHHDPAPLVRACLDNGVHYVDIAEDLDFIERVCEAVRAYPDVRAAVAPGCSTVPGLVALLSQRLRAQEGLASFAVFLNLGSRNPVSKGLLGGLLAPLGRPLEGGERCFRRLSRRRHDDGVTRYYGAYPIPFREGITVGGQVYPVRFFTGFDRYYLNLGLCGAGFVLARLSRRQLAWLVKRLLPLAALCRRFGTEEGHLVVEGRDVEGRPLAAVEVVACRDGLRLPAAPAVWAATRLASGGEGKCSGLQPLPALMSAEEAIEWIRAHGYEVYESVGS